MKLILVSKTIDFSIMYLYETNVALVVRELWHCIITLFTMALLISDGQVRGCVILTSIPSVPKFIKLRYNFLIST